LEGALGKKGDTHCRTESEANGDCKKGQAEVHFCKNVKQDWESIKGTNKKGKQKKAGRDWGVQKGESE